jgi:hypothetical protein
MPKNPPAAYWWLGGWRNIASLGLLPSRARGGVGEKEAHTGPPKTGKPYFEGNYFLNSLADFSRINFDRVFASARLISNPEAV